MEKFLLGVGTFVIGIVVVIVVNLVFAFPLMWCWNYSLVPLFKLPTITWGQAWCIMFISNTLLKSTNVK